MAALDPTTDVSRIAGDMMKEQNPMMKAAAAQGRAAGNARGLLNSSISSGAGVRAALDYVSPMAQQQAGFGQADKQQTRQIDADAATQGRGFTQQDKQQAAGFGQEDRTQSRGIQAAIDQQQAGINADTATQGRSIAADIASQGKLFEAQDRQQLVGINADNLKTDKSIAAQDRQQMTGINANTATQNAAIAADKDTAAASVAAAGKAAASEYNFRSDQSALERTSQERLANLNLKQNDNKAASDMISTMHKLYGDETNTINANKDLTAGQRTDMLNAAKNNLTARTNMVESLYSVNINWAGTNTSGGTTLRT
jgi:hypothetical protein